jgi:hypothetical protein
MVSNDWTIGNVIAVVACGAVLLGQARGIMRGIIGWFQKDAVRDVRVTEQDGAIGKLTAAVATLSTDVRELTDDFRTHEERYEAFRTEMSADVKAQKELLVQLVNGLVKKPAPRPRRSVAA